MENEFIKACLKGNINSAKALLETNQKNNLHVICDDAFNKAFNNACFIGQLKVAQWLLYVKPTINVSADNDDAFRWACMRNHLHIAQWLFKIKPTINISSKNESAFRSACRNNNLKFAQWLFQVKPNIDISAENEYAFRLACRNGNLKFAQWLIQVKPNINISAENNCALKTAFIFKQLNILEFLQSLMPFKYIITKKENISPNNVVRPNNVAVTLAALSLLKIKGYAQLLTADLVFAILNLCTFSKA